MFVNRKASTYLLYTVYYTVMHHYLMKLPPKKQTKVFPVWLLVPLPRSVYFHPGAVFFLAVQFMYTQEITQ